MSVHLCVCVKRERKIVHSFVFMCLGERRVCVSVYLCMCVCVRERQRERQRESALFCVRERDKVFVCIVVFFGRKND